MTMQMPEREWDSAAMTRYGMRWGPVEITRAARLPKGKGAVLIVRTDSGAEAHIYISEKGKRINIIGFGSEVTVKHQQNRNEHA